MFQKSGYILLLCATVVAVTSCRKDFDYAPSAGNLEFSMDTVYLDTIFKGISSSTYTVKVYNRTRDAIIIPSIQLGNGSESAYRLNVDGLAGAFFENITLNARDSLFIAIEVTLEQLPEPVSSFVYTDVILFDSGSFQQQISLVTLVKDAQFLFPPTMGTGEKSTVTLTFFADEEAVQVPGFELTEEQLTFTNQKPYVVYGMAVVPQGKTLTIDPGARVHFHKDAGLLVRSGAQLIINGALSTDQELLENGVVFEGDRLEPRFSDLAGQWHGILLEKEGLGHDISYLTIKNAKVGLFVEGNGTAPSPALTLRNTQIYNSAEHNLWARNAHILAENVVLGSAGNTSLYCSLGGSYSFTHCTIANYWNKGFRRGPALRLDNTVTTSSGQSLQQDLDGAHFRNCIIDGNGRQELVLRTNDDNAFHFTFDHCLLTFGDNGTATAGNPLFNFNDPTRYNAMVLNGESAFLDVVKNDFRISELSEAKEKGSLEWALVIPFDLLGKDRTITADLGAYQFIFEAVEE